MTSSPWLSVLIPVYNVESYIIECLNSVFSQMDDGVEIIVLDDQSTDSSLAVMKSFVDTSKFPIRIMQHEINGGLSAARNSLVKAATGDYVWFLDSDDLMGEGAIDALRNIVSTFSPDLVLCDYSTFLDKKINNSLDHGPERKISTFSGPQRSLSYDKDLLFHGVFSKGRLHSWSKISKRKFWLDSLVFPVGRYYEDMVTTPALLLEIANYFYEPSSWVKYRQREGSILAVPTQKKIDDMHSGLENILPMWLDAYPNLSSQSRFAFLYYSMRVTRYTFKELKKIHKNKASALYKGYVKNMCRYNNITSAAFLWLFLINGKALRLIKFIRYM